MNGRFLSRFTPSLMSPETLEATLVQRQDLATSIVERVRESASTEAKHNILLVGPRGIGKTHLVALAYHRLRRSPELKRKLLIAWLREEEWGIMSFLDLVLRILSALESEFSKPRLERELNRLQGQPPRTAEKKAIRLLLSLLEDRTLLVILENLEDIFAGMGDQGQKKLRGFLQNHSCVCFLATTQSLFGGISMRESPFYGFFNIHHLEKLSFEEAYELLRRLSELSGDTRLREFLATTSGRARVRVLHHLAAGNPRVYVIFNQFLIERNLDELVEPFLKTLDDLTPYYQSRMAFLSPQQRKIVGLLMDRGSALRVDDIARSCFVTHQTASGQLKVLREKGYVDSTSVGRESFYELREPLMRLALEVKKHRARPVRLLLDFLRVWFSRMELEDRLQTSTSGSESAYLQEALGLPQTGCLDAVAICQSEFERYLGRADWARADQVREELVELQGQAPDLLEAADNLRKAGRLAEAAVVYGRVVGASQSGKENHEQIEVAQAFVRRGWVLNQMGRSEESILVCNELLSRFGHRSESEIAAQLAMGLVNKGVALTRVERLDEALGVFEHVIETFSEIPYQGLADPVAKAIYNKGRTLGELGRCDEELSAYGDVAKRFQNDSLAQVAGVVARAMTNRGFRLGQRDRPEEAIAHYDAVLDRFGDREEAIFDEPIINSLLNKGQELRKLGRKEDGIIAFDRLLDRHQRSLSADFDRQVSAALYSKGFTFAELGRSEDAIGVLEEVAERYGDHPEVAVSKNAAWALHEKAWQLIKLERLAESVSAYEKLIDLYQDRREIEFAAIVARALVNKGVALGKLGRKEQQIAVFDKVSELFGDREEEELQEPIVKAAMNKARVLRHLDRIKEAVSEYGKVIERFQDCAVQALTELLEIVADKRVSTMEWNRFLPVWKELRRKSEKLQVPLRVIEAAVQFREDGDERHLLRGLPSEERRILRELFQQKP